VGGVWWVVGGAHCFRDKNENSFAAVFNNGKMQIWDYKFLQPKMKIASHNKSASTQICQLLFLFLVSCSPCSWQETARIGGRLQAGVNHELETVQRSADTNVTHRW